MKSISWNTIREGQPAPYKDSIYEYDVLSSLPEHYVKSFCAKFLYPSGREHNGTFNGSCGYPFGLESYFTFQKIEDGKYRYKVCVPYCD